MAKAKLLDFFIRQTAKQVQESEPTVDVIIRHQWAQLRRYAGNFCEMEIAAIGSVYPSEKKIIKQIERCLLTLEKISKRPDSKRSSQIAEINERIERLRRREIEFAEKRMEKQKTDQ